MGFLLLPCSRFSNTSLYASVSLFLLSPLSHFSFQLKSTRFAACAARYHHPAGTLLDRPCKEPRRNASVLIAKERLRRSISGHVSREGTTLIDLKALVSLPH